MNGNGKMIKQILATNIKARRTSLNLTQASLAELVGTSTSYIGEIEVCKKFPSPAYIENIARVLGMNPYELFFDNSKKHQKEEGDSLPEIKEELKKSVSDIIDEIMFKHIQK